MSLTVLSPLDGRYETKTREIAHIFSESGLISRRVRLELSWLSHLCELEMLRARLSPKDINILGRLSELEHSVFANQVKALEIRTHHDVKAVEYVLREQLKRAGGSNMLQSPVHFACTSEDITNLAYALMLKEARNDLLLPQLDQLIKRLAHLAREHAQLPMLARTNGQAASPTSLGKEIAVFGQRLLLQRQKLADLRIRGKCNGAVGNYNAHLACYPLLDWLEISRSFIEKLGLTWNPLTTQIESHDSLVEHADCLRHINSICIGLCRDMWIYISYHYFVLELKEGGVESGTIPHKVSPTEFENAEGNFGLSSALAHHFSEKLPISRLQRDLSDSTVLRSYGVMLGHHLLAMQTLVKGFSTVRVYKEALESDLEQSWEVLVEPIQALLRVEGVSDGYERFKRLTKGELFIEREQYLALLSACPELSEEMRERLANLEPGSYTGAATRLAHIFVDAAMSL